MLGTPVLLMLIEDNIDQAELVIRTLEEHRIGNRAHHFLDGQSALDYLFRRGECAEPAEAPRPHVILLDLRLPRLDGIDVLKAIKADECPKSIPVIVLTTLKAEKDGTSTRISTSKIVLLISGQGTGCGSRGAAACFVHSSATLISAARITTRLR